MMEAARSRRRPQAWHTMATLLILSCLALPCVGQSAASSPDVKEEERVETAHRIDSLNMLMFVSLLILTVLTIWMFKHRRFRFVHETGLAIIYGLIIGAIITYTSPAQTKTRENVVLSDNSTYSSRNPPDILLLDTGNQTKYKYDFAERVVDKHQQDKELEDKATFDPEVFFNVLLPPIIFNAGYNMKRKHFFKNFGAIMTYAFLGTTISCFVVGTITYGFSLLPAFNIAFTDCLSFGALISATDPVTILALFSDLNVDVDLYALVFGESVLNDAVAIVLSGAIDTYKSSAGGFDGIAFAHSLGTFVGVFFGAFAFGSAMGCVTAILTKYTHIRDYPLLETSLFFLMSYGSFLAAEAAGMTGIVAVLFCGICQAHYTYNNLSPESQARTKELFELLNFLMENFVFTYIGVSTFTFRNHQWNPGFICSSFLAIIVARACNVYTLSFLLNLGRSNKIRYNFQHMMMFSGLRGAIAFALAIRNTGTSERQMIFSTTLLIVIATVILIGGFTTQMLQWLKIRVGVEDETELQNFEALRNRQRYQTMGAETGTAAALPSPSEPRPPPVQEPNPGRLAEKARLVRVWYNIDTKLVKPLLTHARPPLTETMPKCCLPLARLLTTEQQLQGVGRGFRDDSDTDLIVDDQELSYSEPSSQCELANNGGATGEGMPKTSQVAELQIDESHFDASQRRQLDGSPSRATDATGGRHGNAVCEDELSLDMEDTSPLLEFRQPVAGEAGRTPRSVSQESDLLQA